MKYVTFLWKLCVCVPVSVWAPCSFESWGKWIEKKWDSSLMQWTWKHPSLLPAAVITIQLSLQLIPLTTDSLWMHAFLLEYEHTDNTVNCTQSLLHTYYCIRQLLPLSFSSSLFLTKAKIWYGMEEDYQTFVICTAMPGHCSLLATELYVPAFFLTHKHTHSQFKIYLCVGVAAQRLA